ncbi:class I SAM-dependent methyltransferase [Candidatus Woesearchaeota archaeon]|nr:class I SAM-dependent methyltransferase [Candidatus Woesearchaeota archaeon]
MTKRLPYDDKAFDIIICYGVIHQAESDGIKYACGEMNRVLKKGGEAFFHTRSSNQAQFGKLIEAPEYASYGGGVVITQGPTLSLKINGYPIIWHLFSGCELRTLAEENGFKIQHLKEFVHDQKKEGENFYRVSFEGVLKKNDHDKKSIE